MLRTLELALLEVKHLQAREGVPQFTWAKQELRIRGPAEALVAQHEGLVDDHPALIQRSGEVREKRPMQIICNNDRAELAPGERPRTAVLQVRCNKI